MKINKDSNHECTPQMEEHVMELIRDWKETNEAMKDKTCDSGMKILGRTLRPPRKLENRSFKKFDQKSEL